MWLSYLIEHTDVLPLGLISTYDLPLSLAYGWLEKYDAIKLYQLALNGWRADLLNRDITEEQITAWESGTGERLPLPDSMPRHLLNWILPSVAVLQIAGLYDDYVKLSKPEWRTTLSACKGFLSAGYLWGRFAEYVEGIEGLLYSYNFDYFNACFQERLSTFQEGELDNLGHSLSQLIHTRQYGSGISLSLSQADLLRRLQAVAGDLEIGDIAHHWRLDSFEIPDVS